jgi:hypothetical protein
VPRGYAPVAAVLLIAVTVVAAAGVAAFLPSLPDAGPPPEHRRVAADATTDGTIRLTLLSGPAVDTGALNVRVTVAGDPLRHQPPVPFFSATGFRPGPTGAFNVAHDGPWRVAETVSFRVAGTNHPRLSTGDTVRIEFRVRGHLVAVEETTADAG